MTRVDAGGKGRVLHAAPSGSSRISFENLTLTGGRLSGASVFGGGAQIDPSDRATVTLVALHVVNNVIEGDGTGFVGGAGIGVGEIGFGAPLLAGEVRIEDCLVSGNLASSPARPPITVVSAAGVSVGLGGTARFALRGTGIENNVVETDGIVATLGLRLVLRGSSAAVVEDSRVSSNFVRGASSVRAGGLDVAVYGNATVEARRNVVVGNGTSSAVVESHASLLVHQDFDGATGGTLVFTDSIVAGGRSGLYADARGAGSSTLRLTNLTLAGGNGMWVLGNDSDHTSVFNTVIWPGTLSSSDTETGGNLVGADPEFVSASTHDYRVRSSSPAIDAGDGAPPGGLGPSDIAARARRSGLAVDAGAHERQVPEAQNGGCMVDRFGEVPGVAATTPACACFRDDTARSMRCGFFLPDLFFEARIPLPFVPGAKLAADWILHPWTSDTAPYALAAQLLGKQTILLPLDPPGSASGKLLPGKDLAVRVGLVTPESPSTLRLTLRHLPPGAAKPVDSVVEILVPQY
jgi:hypothetical protein